MAMDGLRALEAKEHAEIDQLNDPHDRWPWRHPVTGRVRHDTKTASPKRETFPGGSETRCPNRLEELACLAREDHLKMIQLQTLSGRLELYRTFTYSEDPGTHGLSVCHEPSPLPLLEKPPSILFGL